MDNNPALTEAQQQVVRKVYDELGPTHATAQSCAYVAGHCFMVVETTSQFQEYRGAGGRVPKLEVFTVEEWVTKNADAEFRNTHTPVQQYCP